ncbi:glutathione S-transferase family protein [Providencia rettgeri]|uniref:glutathione S-transferase family protein n=1 Tax=Providencia rettgeri TaxID=587 RepID=UPI0034E060CA
MLKILGRTSSINVRKVLWTAHELNLPFIHEEHWGSTADLKQAEFINLNPNALIPVLVHEKGALWESNTICRYLAAISTQQEIYPNEALEKAEVEKWMDWQASELNPSWRAAFMALVRQDPFFKQNSELVEKSITSWNEKMSMLNSVLAQNKTRQKQYNYICGEQFTLADIVLGLSIQRWLLTPIERPNTPFILDYYHRIINRPAALKCIDQNIV